jgi:uncharacterized cupredoxin-like copper-binding protein
MNRFFLRTAGVLVAILMATSAFVGSVNAGTAVAAAGSASATADTVATVNATLSDSMRITLDRYSVPAGTVRFLVTNAGQSTHELVVLKTDLAQDQLVADPDEAGRVEEQVHMGETGDIPGGRFTGFELQLGPGSYVIICNELGHYTAGMHVAFTVYQPVVNVSLSDSMTISLDRSTIYAGTVTFAVTNRGAITHEFVVLATSLAPDELPASDEPGMISEEANIGETGDIPAGRFSGLALDLAPGTYLVICNEPGHFAAGMHFQLIVLPLPSGDE